MHLIRQMASAEQEERLKKWKSEAGDLIQNVISKNRRKRSLPLNADHKPRSKAGLYQERLIKSAEEGVADFGSWWLEEPGFIEAEGNQVF